MDEVQPSPEESLKRQLSSALNVGVMTGGEEFMPLLLVMADVMNTFPGKLEMDKRQRIMHFMRDPAFHASLQNLQEMLTRDLEKKVFRKLFALLRSLKEFPHLVIKKREKNYFSELSSWMNVMVDVVFDINAKDQSELGNFSRGYSSPEERLTSSGEEKVPEPQRESIVGELQKETDITVKKYYDEIYRPMDFRMLQRLHNGIEIFRLLEVFKKLAEVDPAKLNPAEINELYKGLMMALHRCGRLTLPLLQELRREASQKTFDAIGAVNLILVELLRNDTAAILEDYFSQHKSEKPSYEMMGEMDDDIAFDEARVRLPLVESKPVQFDSSESFLRVLARKYGVSNSMEGNAIQKLNFEYQEIEPFIRLQTLKRVGAAIALFVAMSNLEKMRKSGQESIHLAEEGEPLSADDLMKGGLSAQALVGVRCEQLEICYSELRLALKKAGFLDAHVENKLRIERDENKDAILKNANAVLDLRSLRQCHDHLRALVDHDTVCVLADYVPHDKDLYLSPEGFDPQKSLYRFLVEDYYNQDNRGQASVLNQAALELDKMYRIKEEENIRENYMRLLGDKPKAITSEALDNVLQERTDVEKLEALENIFKIIQANQDGLYSRQVKEKEIGRLDFTQNQIKDVKALQQKWLDIVRANPDTSMRRVINRSELLKVNAGLAVRGEAAKDQALELIKRSGLSARK